MTLPSSLRDRARAGNRSTPTEKITNEPTIVFDVGDDPEALPVAVAWARVMRFCRALPKGSTATVATKTGSYSYRYRGIDDVMTIAGRALREFGVIIMPKKIDIQHKPGQPTWCRVDVTYSITSLGEGELVGVSSGEALDFGDKALVKALTQALRVYLTTAMLMPTYDLSMDSDASPVAMPAPPSPEELRDEMLNPETSMDRMKAILAMLNRDSEMGTRLVPVPTSDGSSKLETLLDMNVRIGKERRADMAASSSGPPDGE